MHTRPLLLVATLLLAGCAGESFTGAALSRADEAQAAAKHGQRVFVLNTHLRPVGRDNPSEAHGPFQLKLQQVSGVTPTPFYAVEWQGHLFNPAGETFTGGQVGGVTPDPFRPVLVVLAGARERSRKIDLRGEARLPAAQAEALIARPQDFQAVFMTEALPGGALGGRFQ